MSGTTFENVTLEDIWNFCDTEQRKLWKVTGEFPNDSDYQQDMVRAYREVQCLIKKQYSMKES